MVEEPGLESKELVLFLFGTIIVVVLMHGLWVAWRKNKQKLRFDFVEGNFVTLYIVDPLGLV